MIGDSNNNNNNNNYSYMYALLGQSINKSVNLAK